MIAFETLQQMKKMIKQLFFFLDYNYFKDYFKMTPTDLSEQQALNVDSKTMQQINLFGNPKSNVIIIFVIEEAKETILFCINIISI